MKKVFFSLALIVAANFAHAGGFGGPPPFTNGSPLVTGVDGSYQATARGTNMVGVFRFTYSGGTQTSSPTLPSGTTVDNLLTDPYNDYVFFVEGLTYRGLVQANINTGSIAGVFDNGSANVAVWGDADGLGILSFVSGFFQGSMDQQSPYAAFSGDGEITVSGPETRIVETFPDGPDAPPVYVEIEVIAAQFAKEFKFRGVRATLNTAG